MTMRWTYLIPVLAMACSSAEDDNDNNNMNPPPNTCGDGVMRGSEQCDDGNTSSNDGCSATCLNEGGGTCGNNQVESLEQCDDGNTTSGDGCSANCTTETGAGAGTCSAPFQLVLMNDMGTLVGEATGDTTGSTDQMASAACDGAPAGAGKDHVWSFTLTDTRDVGILIDSDVTMFDTIVRVTSAACDAQTELPEFTGADGCANAAMAAEEFIGYISLTPGTYFITIDGATAGDAGAYRFLFVATAPACGDGVLDPLEFCDDGNSAISDGCTAKCEVEDGYTCTFDSPSVCTMGGNSSSPAANELKINEYLAIDTTTEDSNCDGSTSSNADEFVELVNTTNNKTLNLEGVTISDSLGLRHTFGALTLPPGKAVVVWGGGTPGTACTTNVLFDLASSGQLGLNDGGDSITVALNGTTLSTVTYAGGDVSSGYSNNRSPDVNGNNFVRHDMVTGAVGKHSPGKRANGTAF